MKADYNLFERYFEPCYEDIQTGNPELNYRIFPIYFPDTTGGIVVRSHWHKEIEIVAVIEGRLRKVINGNIYYLRPGDVSIVGGMDIHSLYAEEGAPINMLVLQFDPISLTDLSKKRANIASTVISGDFAEHLTSLLHAAQEAENADEAKDLLIKGYLCIILGELIRRYPRGTEPYGDNDDTKAQLKGLMKAVELINTKLVDPPTLTEAAEIAGMSPSHFSRFFKKNIGKGFVTYINEIHLNLAANMLISMDLTIGEIALRTGFRSLNHFNKLFRRQYGMTPGEFRKRHSKE